MSEFRIGIEFTRMQLIDAEYDPIEHGDVDLEDLRSRYEGYVDPNHAAAVRGILVREGKRDWKWIWGIGLLHDEIVRETGYPRLYARYRNQFPMLPRIEFENGADVHAALLLLLNETPIVGVDLINIKTPYRRAMSIEDYTIRG